MIRFLASHSATPVDGVILALFHSLIAANIGVVFVVDDKVPVGAVMVLDPDRTNEMQGRVTGILFPEGVQN